MKRKILLILSLMIGLYAIAQRPKNFQKPTKINLSGKVIDQETQQPLEYATITLKSARFPDRLQGESPMKKGFLISKFSQGVILLQQNTFLLKKTSKKGLFLENQKT